MKEDVLKLGTLLLILTPGRHTSFGCYQIKEECFIMSAKSARVKKLALLAMFTAIGAVLITRVHWSAGMEGQEVQLPEQRQWPVPGTTEQVG